MNHLLFLLTPFNVLSIEGLANFTMYSLGMLYSYTYPVICLSYAVSSYNFIVNIIFYVFSYFMSRRYWIFFVIRFIIFSAVRILRIIIYGLPNKYLPYIMSSHISVSCSSSLFFVLSGCVFCYLF